jgi:hypothetical protein
MTNWNEEVDGEDDELEELQPGDTDYDLSEQHPYSWEPQREPAISPTVLFIVSLLLIAALVVPSVLIVLQYR